MREEFESWFYASKYAQVAPPTKAAEQAAWDGWQASRAELVVKMPRQKRIDPHCYDQGKNLKSEGFNEALACCRLSIEDAGIQVKP
jgi:hypothetical protein